MVFFCQLGDGERREFSPRLRVLPAIENLKVVCNEQTHLAELRWESPQGGVDYYQVDAGSGWVNITENVFIFNHPSTSF